MPGTSPPRRVIAYRCASGKVHRPTCILPRYLCVFVSCNAKAALEAAAAAENEEKGENASEVSPELLEVVPKSLEGFDAGMNDDLNTPR